MTDKDWKELGVKPSLGREWQLVMDGLWIIAQAEFGKKAINKDNQIHIGKWLIYANFINNEYISVKVDFDEEDRLEIRHTNKNLPSILKCVFEVIKATYKNPLK